LRDREEKCNVVSFDSTVTVKRTPDEVFAYVTEPTNEPKWHKDVVDVKRTSTGPIGAGSTFEWLMNFMGSHRVQFEVKEFVTGRREVIAAVSSGPLRPTFTYTFEQVAGGTRFTRHGDIRVAGIMRLIEPVMKIIAPKHMQGLLQKLKVVMEEAA
jgi:uncharacterized protein YndB with AHSA1/START domain